MYSFFSVFFVLYLFVVPLAEAYKWGSIVPEGHVVKIEFILAIEMQSRIEASSPQRTVQGKPDCIRYYHLLRSQAIPSHQAPIPSPLAARPPSDSLARPDTTPHLSS